MSNEDKELKSLLRDLSSAISRCLSSPENVAKLERLQDGGFDLYLILEASDSSTTKINPAPILPLHVEQAQPQPRTVRRFELTKEDKVFLRTLKIKVD